MRIPVATYRLQFGPSLRFADARALLPYLSELGISDLYASPIFQATPGSTHGYDVTDPDELNPELGTAEDFQALTAEVQAHRMGWLQDIVPNHMAYADSNRMLMDLFENGPRSRFYDFFDIFRDHPDPELRTKLLAPFLGRPLEEVLARGQLQLVLDEDGLALRYFTWRFPLSLASYDDILGHADPLSGSQGGDDPGMRSFHQLRQSFACLSGMDDSLDKREQVAQAKKTLRRLRREHPMIRIYLDGVLESYNRPLGAAFEPSPLHRLLDRQYFQPVFWQVAYENINYRRFFYLSEFIALRTEDRRVFEYVHRRVLDLVRAGIFTGLRIDHVDGLYNPRQYLQRLHHEVPEAYLVVEKILELYEYLRTEWPIEGTSGYQFCNYVNGLFCRQENEKAFTDLYHEFLGAEIDYSQQLYEEKRKVLQRRMAGEMTYLAHLVLQAQQAAEREPEAVGAGGGWASAHAVDPPISGQAAWAKAHPTLEPWAIRDAVTALIAGFPVYRTYVDAHHWTEEDRTILSAAFERARDRCPECRPEVDQLIDLLLSVLREDADPAAQETRRHLLMRFQQFTGPAMAKGFEDTLLYVYNRFVSLNEVGGDPDTFGVSTDKFHRYYQARAKDWPHAMNATSTHDSKRGEDVRARLNVLSEIPEHWRAVVTRWAQMNERHKQRCGDVFAPVRNDEYLLYQTLVGTLPFDEGEYDDFKPRVQDYLVKAVREAKTYSNWVQPNEPYESACRQFVDKILDRAPANPFWADFLPFQKEIASYGVYNSLSQTMLKMTCTGLPDFYQGSELWDLNLVDPDNRRPVDFERRRRLLKELRISGTHPNSQIESGAIKLFLIQRGLRARRENRDIFDAGEYLPASVTGSRTHHVVAFFRVQAGVGYVLVVVPRFLTSLVRPGAPPLGVEVWEDTSIVLPEDAPAIWQNALTGEAHQAQGQVFVGDALAEFPVALFVGRASSPA